MSTNRFKVSYDKEYDNLLIYSQSKRGTYGIEWGDLELSYDKNGTLVNLFLNSASELLTNLTNSKVTKKTLALIDNCKLNIKEKSGIVYINFTLYFEDKKMHPIEDTLTVKAFNYQSPISA
ncbi:MAG TPA: hypothetical protein VFF13_03280 [archaeon]|nr:hypothetical protein [archaeon]